MRIGIILLFCFFLIAGCGGNNKAKKFEGVKAKHNYMQDGFAYLKKADVAKAIQSFNQAIQKDPTNAQNYIILGQVYLRLGNYSRAANTFAAAIKVEPTNAVAYFLLGQSQVMAGNIQGAVTSMKKSMLLYKAQNDEENFKKVAAFLKNLLEKGKEEAQKKNL